MMFSQHWRFCALLGRVTMALYALFKTEIPRLIQKKVPKALRVEG